MIKVRSEDVRVISKGRVSNYLVKFSVRKGNNKRCRCVVNIKPDIISKTRIVKNDRVGYEIEYDEKCGNELYLKIYITSSRKSYSINTYVSRAGMWETAFSIPYGLEKYLKEGDTFVAQSLESYKMGEFAVKLTKVKENYLFNP